MLFAHRQCQLVLTPPIVVTYLPIVVRLHRASLSRSNDLGFGAADAGMLESRSAQTTVDGSDTAGLFVCLFVF